MKKTPLFIQINIPFFLVLRIKYSTLYISKYMIYLLWATPTSPQNSVMNFFRKEIYVQCPGAHSGVTVTPRNTRRCSDFPTDARGDWVINREHVDRFSPLAAFKPSSGLQCSFTPPARSPHIGLCGLWSFTSACKACSSRMFIAHF